MQENQTGQETKLFEITDTNVKQSVHVIKCSDITVIVKGKVGEILLDQCKKVTLQFDAALGSCNIVNSTKCHVHMVDGTPCVQIDRSNGTEVYLSKDSEANTNILTSGSTETSVYSAPLEAHGDGVRGSSGNLLCG